MPEHATSTLLALGVVATTLVWAPAATNWGNKKQFRWKEPPTKKRRRSCAEISLLRDDLMNMTNASATEARVVFLLMLGLTLTGCLVECFSSSLVQQKALSGNVVGAQKPIIRPDATYSHRNFEAFRAITLKHKPFWSSSALGVTTGVVEGTSNVSSSGSDGGDYGDGNRVIPEFGADGLYHVTNEAEYK